jgi:phosphoribosylanthranilate isomerase
LSSFFTFITLTTFNKLTTLIKASRIAHLTDARYFAAKEADYLGFNLEAGTEGYLDPIYMKAIREWVEGPKIVGEFSRTPIRVVSEAAAFYGLDTVQVSAKTHGAQLTELEGLEVILEIEVGEAGLPFSIAELQAFAAQADVFLFNFTHSNLSISTLYAEKAHWQEVFSIRPSLVQADIPAAEWPALLESFGLAGISIVGGEEEQVGVKSYEEVDAVFEGLGRG